MCERQIELRGVRVNNLNDVDLNIKHGKFVAICGVSGSGKSSLAFDTLYAEGQRRYFESLSTYTRQFLDQLEKPDADRIGGIPPAIALRANRNSAGAGVDKYRTTVGSASEILSYLRLLYAKIGTVVCPKCDVAVQRHDPDSVVNYLGSLPAGVRFQIAFRQSLVDDSSDTCAKLKSNGFRRVVIGNSTFQLDELLETDLDGEFLVIVDRLTTGTEANDRAGESLETAFTFGDGVATILLQQGELETNTANGVEIDSRKWSAIDFSQECRCTSCRRNFPNPDSQLFNFSSPIGACSVCEGFGSVLKLDMNLIVPDPSKSISGGAIAPWNTPAYEHERIELTELAPDFDIDVDQPFCDLPDVAVATIWNGVADRDFGGLSGFFGWLEKRKYKVQIAVFLNRWKSRELCTRCGGSRLNENGLAFRIGDKNIAEFCDLEVADAIRFLADMDLSEYQQRLGGKIVLRISQRLEYLEQVGLGYLTLGRQVGSLSSGEAQRVMLTKILGSTLTSMLYVLDEPTSGLHPVETPMLVNATKRLRDRGNTVVVVDHDENMILAADRIVEIGPGAGLEGGNVVFEGTSSELIRAEESVTGRFISRLSGLRSPENKRREKRGSLKLIGAAGNNLKHIDVEFPLGCLCLVTGVSGSGKSTLVQETLYPAICQRKKTKGPRGLIYDDLFGENGFDEVVLVDQSPIGRSSRSNPVTYVKAFDEIRKAFAETVEAKTRNFKPGHFSFNVDGGRCERCRGEGQLTIDMQFMTDIHVKCDQCQGTRFRDSILEVKYRAKNIDDVLNMTAREAFGFFRGNNKLQGKLKALIDVGLDYIRLGQSATTLSSGEAQRLKLAHYLNAPKKQRVLFLMDEPTFGLHMRDILKLVDCFNALLAAGHSLIVIEHNLQLMKYADWIIDMGPGAAGDGGRLVACGTPEAVAESESESSVTGKCLKDLLEQERAALSLSD